jgi:hypothetical protein
VFQLLAYISPWQRWNNNVLKVMEIPWLEQPMPPTSKLCKGNVQLKNLEPLQDYIKRGCGMNHHWNMWQISRTQGTTSVQKKIGD